MRILLPALCGALALAGCASDAFVKNNLPAVCTGVEVSYQAFAEISALIALKPSTIKLVEDSHADAVKLCNNPGADTAAAAVTVAKIGVKIGVALLEARRAKAALAGG